MLQELKGVDLVGIRQETLRALSIQFVKVLLTVACTVHGRASRRRVPEQGTLSITGLFLSDFHSAISLAITVDNERLRRASQRCETVWTWTVDARLQMWGKETNHIQGTIHNPFRRKLSRRTFQSV
jgi:hypothetical protein